MKICKDDLSQFFVAVLAFTYAVAVSLIPNLYFRDRDNYINYATDAAGIFNSYDNVLFLFFNEPLFLLINISLSFVFEVSVVPKVFVFFISYTIFYVAVRKSKNLLLGFLAFLLVFCTAQVFHLQLVVLRQGFATALFIWLVYYCWGGKRFYFSLPFLGLIHSSFFIVTIVFYLDYFVSVFISRRVFIRVLFQIFFGLLVSAVGIYLASALGIRQASAEHVIGPVNVGGGNFILWFSVLVILMTLSSKKLLSDAFYLVAMFGLAVYLSMYFFSPISGRLISIFLPFCIVAITMNFSGRVFFVLILVLFANTLMFSSSIENNSLTDAGGYFFTEFLDSYK